MQYRRAIAPGGTCFFTVVTDRRRPILASAEAVDALREAFRSVRRSRPFEIDAIVVMPDHLHCIWTLPPGDVDPACEQCHSTSTWEDIKPLHDVGDFSLKGAHNNVGCERCHRDNRPLAGSGNLCINCHRQDDIHSNALSPRCGECHTQWSFAPAKFDHSRVGCNLTGVHRTVACFDCHRNGNFSAMSPQCASCHIDDAQKRGGTHAGYTSCTGTGCHNRTRGRRRPGSTGRACVGEARARHRSRDGRGFVAGRAARPCEDR